METNSLVIFTQASKMLAEANTIQKAKELKDLALTASDWAKRKDMGEEAVQYARSYALDAERKMGQLLKETERQKPGEYQRSPDVTVAPSLSDLGLTKRDSSEAQKLAELPEEQYQEVREGKQTRSGAIKEVKKQETDLKRQEIAESGKALKPTDRWHIEVADIHTYKTDKQFDFIITDPPYPKEYLPLYEALAVRSKEWLKPDGLLIAMCGQSYLDQIYSMMSKHLTYYWTSCYLTPHQPTPLRQRQVNTSWKALLIYSLTGEYKGKTFGDVYTSPQPEREVHEWQQSVSGMLSIIQQVCLPGQSIFDPFLGSGTTGVAALMHGCLFQGIDIDEQSVNISKSRLNDTSTE